MSSKASKFLLKKTDSKNTDFQELVQKLNAHFVVLNGEMDSFFAQFNKIDAIKHVILAYENDTPVGCGAIRTYSDTQIEIKRMYVLPEKRGQSIAAQILTHLENWASELGYTETILETLKTEENVVRLYAKCGYQIIPNYGQYVDSEMSVCMRKFIGNCQIFSN